VSAEYAFQAEKKLDVNGNGVGEYGTLEQLVRVRMYTTSQAWPQSYEYLVVVGGDPIHDEKEFLVYATPRAYGRPSGSFLPGHSTLQALRYGGAADQFSYATDETGIIRKADLGTSRPVTRREVQTWAQVR
jgi:hypothetical protein